MSGRIRKQELHSSVNNELDKIKENKDEIDVLSGKVDENEGDIEGIEEDIGSIKEDLEGQTSELVLHKEDYKNPHNVTKDQIGLSNVDNEKQARSSDGYRIVKNGSNGNGIINFIT